MSEILVLFDTRHGSTKKLAELICRGIEKTGCSARLRTVPEISSVCEQTEAEIPEQGTIYVNHQDLIDCDGLVLGSPTRFGNMSASLKYFLDSTSALWLAGELSGKPAGVFTSTSSMHGGQETTLISMMLPLLHHGMILVGIPYSEASLINTQQGGSPYGAGHIAGAQNNNAINEDEKKLAMALGERVAKTAVKLSQ